VVYVNVIMMNNFFNVDIWSYNNHHILD